jgi:3-oxoacyl-[acyl-carrier protein] reductase
MSSVSRVALITGAGRGIGRAIAQRLVASGVTPIVADLDAEAARAAAEELREQDPRAHGLAVDVSDETSVTSMFAEIERRFGRLDIAINNAGISPGNESGIRTVEQTTLELWSRTIAVNLTGAFLVSRAAIPLMRRGHWGRIIIISSSIAQGYTPATSYYAASKAGLLGFSRILAGEVGRDGITVNCVTPGLVATPLTERYRSGGREERVAANSPVGRIGQPEDIAGAVAYLASEEASFVTGATLNVSGGTLMP